MGDVAFTKYMSSIQAYIDMLLDASDNLEKRIETYKCKVEEESDLEHSKVLLKENEVELSKMNRHIEELELHFKVIKKRWGNHKDRDIGYIVYAPAIGVGRDPYDFTCDFCVIELDKEKFKHLTGNVLDLGALIFLSH